MEEDESYEQSPIKEKVPEKIALQINDKNNHQSRLIHAGTE
jgi:hypothetical protein